ncbi:MAG: PocR ligand-binding domain-containing protein [Clostridia bacterium]|nr:PocR ligand-binding domain-containing protein [Clostridia bacterium]
MSFAEGITNFINAVRNLSGVGVCYYDLKNFFNYNKNGIKNNRGHYCSFCEKARLLPNGRENCEKSDKIEAVALASQYKEPFFYECHMGMRELVVPLIQNDTLLGILFVGQCRIDNDHESQIIENAKKMGGNPNEFLSLYNQLPLIAQKDIISIGAILSQYFEVQMQNGEHLSRELACPIVNMELCDTIKVFIRENYKNHSLSTQTIADEFYVNASYISRAFSQKVGATITEYIENVRMEHAKQLLNMTDAPIRNISLNVGFEDANYFTRVFKRSTGVSPSKYRQMRK